jgi:ribosomal protein S18 acetylase RimI-like enzyme
MGSRPHAPAPSVRAASVTDAAALLPLYARFHSQLAQLVPTPEDLHAALEWFLQRPDATVLVAEAEAGFIGYVLLRYLATSGTAVIDDVFVQAKYRRLGCGQALLRQAVATAVARGCRGIILDTDEANAPARKLYASFGFALEAKAQDATTCRYRLALPPGSFIGAEARSPG